MPGAECRTSSITMMHTNGPVLNGRPWKLIAGMTLTIQDLEEVKKERERRERGLSFCCFQIDLLFTRALIGIRDIDKGGVTEENFAEVELELLHNNALTSLT